jgi:hypothetical protein
MLINADFSCSFYTEEEETTNCARDPEASDGMVMQEKTPI